MRDKFADMIDDFFGVDSAYFGVDKYELADHLIANGVTVQDVPETNVGEWISVKDRLPEKWQNVLVVRSDGKIRFDFICSTGCWYDDVNYVGYSVNHWMPLPQPPKGE